MDSPPRSGKKISGILKETLFEIARGKSDPFHRVVSDVLEDINSPDKSVEKRPEKEKGEPD